MVSKTPGGKWKADLLHLGDRYHVGIFGSEAAARAAVQAEKAAIVAGTSEICRFPGTLTLKTFSDRIQVKVGTLKRWIHEGMPVIRGAAFLRIDPAVANEWILGHYPNTVAFRRKSVVYFVQRESDYAIKIGFSSDVVRRVGELRKKQRCACALLAVVPGDKEREVHLHGRFSSSLIADEWFLPSPDLLQFIASIGHGVAA